MSGWSKGAAAQRFKRRRQPTKAVASAAIASRGDTGGNMLENETQGAVAVAHGTGPHASVTVFSTKIHK